MLKQILLCTFVFLSCSATAQLDRGAPTTQPQQDEMMIGSANKKLKATMADLQRDSSVVYLRLVAEMDKAQRHAEAQQEQARLDLAARIALSMSRLASGSEGNGPQLRQAYTTELAQAGQTFNQRLAEIDAEQNQLIGQAVQRFAQQKAELLNSYPKDVLATIQRLTQQMSAPDLGKTVTRFKVTLPAFSELSAADDAALENAYRTGLDAARKTYTESLSEARAKVVTNIQRSLEAAPDGPDEEQTTEIKNAIKRLGLWAADSMDTYQIALKSALRKYQLAEDNPETDVKGP